MCEKSKEDAIAKIKKMGEVGYIISVAFEIILIVGMVCAIVGAIIMAYLPDDLMEMRLAEAGRIEFSLQAIQRLIKSDLETDMRQEELIKMFEEGLSNGKLSVNGQAMDVSEVAIEGDKLSVDMFQLYPRKFSMNNVMGLLIVLLIYLAAIMVTAVAISKLCKAVKNCETPFEENVIKRLRRFAYSLIPWVIMDSAKSSVSQVLLGMTDTYYLSINIGMIVVVLAVFVLVFIFKYGAVLQQESDETL